MERNFDHSLRDLKENMIQMANHVEKSIEIATTALQEKNLEKLKEVYSVEGKINLLHKKLDEQCLNLLALQQPMAKDLRLIIAMIKANTDLERMGDQAVNIAHSGERYLSGTSIRPLVDLPHMAGEVRRMVRGAIDSFVQQNEVLAEEVLKLDDSIDSLKRKIFDDVIAHMKQHPEHIDQGLSLILIARNLERLGDHATNIAEDVIFVTSGKDIRHASLN